MKITFLSPTPSLSGGVRVIGIYADRLRARGHDVVVVAPRWRAPDWSARLNAWIRGRAPRRLPRVTHYDRMQARLHLLGHNGPITAADVPDADVVIATWWETAFMAASLPPEKGRRFYFIQHHEVHEHLPNHISAGSYYLPLNKITISGWLRDTMANCYGDPDVVLIPNSVDNDLFHAAPRERQPLPTIGLMYATQPFKGLDVALAAIAETRQSHPNLQVIVFGKEPIHKMFPLPSNAQYLLDPGQDQLRKIYAACDVFLATSRSEGFGLPILEAMACRTPVVATRTGCAEDVIENGVEGYVVDVEDVSGVVDRLRQALDLPEADWKRMSAAAHARTLSYSWDDATTLLERALECPS